jgi:hypothetical protein
MIVKNDRDDDRLERLFADARKSQPYNANLEYGFETRIMAKIRAQRGGQKPFYSWAWRLMPAFVSAVLILGIWVFLAEYRQLVDMNLIMGINNEETMLVASLTGE